MNNRTKLILLGILVMLLIPATLGVFYLSTDKTETEVPPASSISPSVTPTPMMTVLEIFQKGVEVKMDGKDLYMTATDGMKITEGSSIRTDATGRAQIVYPGGTVTRIDFDSEVTVTKNTEPDQNIIVTILKGRIWSRIKKLLGNESYQTETSDLVATVRGTSYGHGLLEDNSSKGTVTKGKVEMGCKNEAGELTVQKDEKAVVNCEKETGLEVLDQTEKDKEDEWYLFNEEEDENLNDRFGSETYSEDEEVLGASDESEDEIQDIFFTSSFASPTPSRIAPTAIRDTPTPGPSATFTPGPTSTHTPAPAPSSTPKPTHTPTPTPTLSRGITSTDDTPTPTPRTTLLPTPIIYGYEASTDWDGTYIYFYGENFLTGSVEDLEASLYKLMYQYSFPFTSFIPDEPITDNNFSAYFENIDCGYSGYEFLPMVKTPAGIATASASFMPDCYEDWNERGE